MNVQTYLFFPGNCRQALEFYQEVIGASVTCLLAYSDGPPDQIPPGWESKVFHSTVHLGDSTVNMSDSTTEGPTPFSGFAMLVHLESAKVARDVCTALQIGGELQMPMQKTPWAQCYGIVRDKFGVTWKLQATEG